MIEILTNKPVLIGLHLGLAIIGIDAFLWLMGELVAGVRKMSRLKWASLLGLVSFLLSWLAGGYYYVLYYGSLVKPVIKAGLAPWAHLVFMETKEHIFLFIPPLAATALLITLLNRDVFTKAGLNRPTLVLAGLIVFIGLAVGTMGFIVSAAARWG